MRTLFVACLLFTASAWADDAPTYRELACRVVDENGRPVCGVAIRLGGLERDAPDFEDDEERVDKEPGWRFTTDADGCFTARFDQFHAYQHLAKHDDGYTGPGYGEFYFVVQKAGYAGGVSREVLNLDDEARVRVQAKAFELWHGWWDRHGWQQGEFAPLLLRDDQPIREPLVIVLKRGLDVRGRIVDTAGRPVRGEGVGVSLDLHYGSHTGAGGTIFAQGTTTDRAGRFRLHHVYPNVFTISTTDDDDKPPYWIKTRVRGRWFDRVEDEITPRRGDARQPTDYEKSIDLCLVVSRRPLYRYFGRVSDEAGRGLAHAAVLIRSVRHCPARDWGECHFGGQMIRTDADGNYSIRVGSHFVDGIWVREGDESGGIDAEGDQLLAPGRHDFVVRLKKPGE